MTRAIENAQRKVEARNFDMRKQILEYDDVANDQRKVIYQQRAELLESTDISETIDAMREGVLSDLVAEHIPHGSMEEQWDASGLEKTLGGRVSSCICRWCNGWSRTNTWTKTVCASV